LASPGSYWSTSVTCSPLRASHQASEAPNVPAPTMTTSIGGGRYLGAIRVVVQRFGPEGLSSFLEYKRSISRNRVRLNTACGILALSGAVRVAAAERSQTASLLRPESSRVVAVRPTPALRRALSRDRRGAPAS